MKFSVIIPVYNSSMYLRSCLDSILAQTCADFECICIDDGSTDDSPGILDAYSRKDARIMVVHKSNEGVSVARNLALSKASGDVVCFVDSDDEVDANWLEAYDAAFQDPEVDVVRLNSSENWVDYGYPWAYAVKRAIAVKARFPKGVAMGEDGLYVAMLQPFVRTVVTLPVVTYRHIERVGSAMGRKLESEERLRYLNAVLSIVQRQPDIDKTIISGKTSAGILYWACRPLDFKKAREIRNVWKELRGLGCACSTSCEKLFVVPYWLYGISGWLWPIRIWAKAVAFAVAVKRRVF